MFGNTELNGRSVRLFPGRSIVWKPLARDGPSHTTVSPALIVTVFRKKLLTPAPYLCWSAF